MTTGSKLVFIDIDGTLADENPRRARVGKNRRVRTSPGQRPQALHLHRAIRAENRTQHPRPRFRRRGFRGRRTGEYRRQAAVPAPRIAPEAVDAAMAVFCRSTISRATSGRVRTACTSREGYRRHLESKGKTWNRGEFARFWHLLDEVEVPAGSTLGHTIRVSKGSYFTSPESGR